MRNPNLKYMTKEEKEEYEQEQKVRIETLGRIYQHADRVITGDPVEVKVVESGPAPAWSDGKTVFFNASNIEDFDLDELVQLNGLNYHEVCHLMYSPRKASKIVEFCISNNLMRSLNILEDQRIETLMTGRFPSVVPYFQSMVLRWLMDDETGINFNYISIRGRRYLDRKITEAFRDNFVDKSLLKPIAKIVDEYRTLVFPEDMARGMELVKEFQEQVLDKLPWDPNGGHQGGTCVDRSPVASGRPEKGINQKKDIARATKNERKADDIDEPKDEQPCQEVSMSEEEQVNARNKQSAATQKPAFSIKPGKGHVPSQGGVPEDLKKLLTESIAAAMSRKDVQADVKAKQRVLLGGDGKHTGTIKRGKYSDTAVPQDVLLVAKKFQVELEKLKSDADPTWIRETPSGKVNISRYISGCDIDVAFDRWDEGNDSTDIEAVILIDRSGSMAWNENDRLASQACWVIKRALEAIEAPVTVYAFDDKTELAYSRTDKVNKSAFKFIFGQGGTDPEEGLLEAERLLMSSRAANKILFVITDGAFYSTESDNAIKRMSSRGVLTTMVLLSTSDTNQMNDKSVWHEAEIRGQLKSAAALIPFAKSVVINAVKKRSHKR